MTRGSVAALRRQARLAQGLTVGWMVLEGGIAVGAGVAARSVVLTAFGFDSAIEVVASLVVLRALLMAGTPKARSVQVSASRLVGLALYALIAYILAASVIGLLLGIQPSRSPIGVAVTAVSVPVMAVLWRWRLGLAERLEDPALKADAACSVVCIYLAVVALAGLLVNQLLGWWWADSLAALGLIWWIRGEAREAWHAEGGIKAAAPDCCCPAGGPHPCSLPGCPCF